ncbi:hypothetical protein N7468_007523 [Penicillium chermesinum]|uniref:Zn(2)-C6 fungal-type domain-containing protein n=1 Tax=Penicillium chermesinum TaxID=63820 RepID=A0A9W9NWM0_9EURO|nr:uncharacterized protein N7468_007523 [Penicillium chermesinum]KAJ5226298.1 hypothetical protein N7468_007523 [Penicillium chermesinum]
MAGPGGGPPRKSHTKSRNGCKTCKRRHIRCDETFPQCRNCTKHNCRCDYQDTTVQTTSPTVGRGPDLLMTPEIEMEIDNWHRTGIPPFPELMQCPLSGWTKLPRADLRLVHHIVGVSIDLHRRGLSSCTVWAHKMPNFLAIALSNDFVMSSILALSSFHLAFLTGDQENKQVAYHHKVTAFQGLQTAITSFSKDNCEAVLAASVLLSWQATERQSWVSLQQGISSIIESMHPFWKQESELTQLVEAQRALSASGPDFPLSLEDDVHQLDQTIRAIQVMQRRVSHISEHSQKLGELIEYLRKFHDEFTTHPAEQNFERVQVLRRWLFWLPTAMLHGPDCDLMALPILSQFFGAAIILDRFIPETGGAYLAALSVAPIEEMSRILAAHSAADPFNADLRLGLSLMDLPQHIVARYRSRLPWSPRSSVEHYSPAPPSPFHGLPEYPPASSSSPASASPSYAAYTPPLQSPPAVTVAGSPFQLAEGYVTAAPQHNLYPPSPQLLEPHDQQLGLSDPRHLVSLPQPSTYTHPHPNEAVCADIPRTGGSLGLGMEVYSQAHHFDIPGMVPPEACWS